MSKQAQGAAERRSGTKTVIGNLLEERRELLVLYEQVAGIGPYSNGLPTPEAVSEFSQVLVDYIAAGHFGLYERIAQGKERRQRVIDVAEEVYPRIAATTDTAVAFNDSYESSDKNGLTGEMAAQLPQLGESLATRIDLEDRVIAQMLAR
jgi:regulator of sigma D